MIIIIMIIVIVEVKMIIVIIVVIIVVIIAIIIHVVGSRGPALLLLRVAGLPCPISLLRLSLLRFVGSKLLGNSLWAR